MEPKNGGLEDGYLRFHYVSFSGSHLYMMGEESRLNQLQSTALEKITQLSGQIIIFHQPRFF